MGAEAGQRSRDGAALPPAVMVHGLVEAAAALALAGPAGVLLLSAPGAAGSLGAAGFAAILEKAAAAHPKARWQAALDCGDAPGQALSALRTGFRLLVLAPCPGFDAVAVAAEEYGVEIWTERPQALDLGLIHLKTRGGRNKLAQWLCPAG